MGTTVFRPLPARPRSRGRAGVVHRAAGRSGAASGAPRNPSAGGLPTARRVAGAQPLRSDGQTPEPLPRAFRADFSLPLLCPDNWGRYSADDERLSIAPLSLDIEARCSIGVEGTRRFDCDFLGIVLVPWVGASLWSWDGGHTASSRYGSAHRSSAPCAECVRFKTRTSS